MKKLKEIYAQLDTNKSYEELALELESINVRTENGRDFDALFHYADGSVRWLEFKGEYSKKFSTQLRQSAKSAAKFGKRGKLFAATLIKQAEEIEQVTK